MTNNFKIFDTIIFEGNIDLLNLRILEFNDVVNYFIIVPNSKESTDIINSNIVEKENIIIFNQFQDATQLYNDLKEFIRIKYETFDDLIFISRENEIPNFNNLDKIVVETKLRYVPIEHKTLCWNIDFLTRENSTGSFVFTFSKFLTNPNILEKIWRTISFGDESNFDKIESGWKFLNFHEATESETFARENLLPSVNYESATTYKLIKRENNFVLPKNIGILAYYKIGREYMKKHLFLVESSNSINLNEINKLYDTVSIIEFSENSNEIIAENIGESVYKSILNLPNNVLYGEKPLKEFQEDYKKNEIKKIVETVFPQDQDSIRIIYRGFDDVLGTWESFKNEKFSEIINPS